MDPGCLTSVRLKNYFLFHVDFEAKNTDVPHAPKEMFFAELTTPELTSPNTAEVFYVRLCVSLGPVKSISGLFLTRKCVVLRFDLCLFTIRFISFCLPY